MSQTGYNLKLANPQQLKKLMQEKESLEIELESLKLAEDPRDVAHQLIEYMTNPTHPEPLLDQTNIWTKSMNGPCCTII